MVEFTHVVQGRAGLHARPVAEICSFAGSYDGKITLAFSGQTVSATDIMGVMGLGARQGDELCFSVEGPDEQSTADRLRAKLESCLWPAISPADSLDHAFTGKKRGWAFQ